MLRRPIAIAATALAPWGAAAQEDCTLTISVYSFAQDAFDEIVYTPFEEMTGCEIVVETGNSVERLAKIEANRADPVIDMAVLSAHDALAASRDGLLQPIDVGALENYDKLYDLAKDPLGDNMAVGYTFYATSIVYRSDLVDVDSWEDLLSEELAGRVAFPDVTTNQGPPAIYMLGKALGDADTSLEVPMQALGEHADDIVTFYVRSSQLVQLMQQEEILAAPIGRFAWGSFKDSGLPVAWAEPEEGQTGGLNVMVMTAGNGNEELATRFMDFWISTPVQTALAEALIDSPANAEVEVAEDVADNLTFGAETAASLDLLPPEAILDNRDAWIDQWNTLVVQ